MVDTHEVPTDISCYICHMLAKGNSQEIYEQVNSMMNLTCIIDCELNK